MQERTLHTAVSKHRRTSQDLGLGDAPSCRVKVAFCGLTAATTPCTSVFGGFCRVTMTEIPIKPDAMVGEH